MARARVVKYYNGRLQGKLTDEICRRLETLMEMQEARGSIENLKHSIYDLSPEDVKTILEEKSVNEDIDLKMGTLTDNQTISVAYCYYAEDVILADSVGLGKTVEMAALLNLKRLEKSKKGLGLYGYRYILLTEKNLVKQTQEALIQFTGEYVHSMMGDAKSVQKWIDEHGSDFLTDGGGIVCPHSVFNSELFHRWIEDTRGGQEEYQFLDYIIVDEGSVLGNTSTKIYKNATRLKEYTFNQLIANATPFESNLRYMYGQFNWIDSDFLMNKGDFEKMFYVYDYTGAFPQHKGKYKNSDKFRQLISYRYVRQTRKALGAKVEDVQTYLKLVDLSKDQKRLMKQTTMYQLAYDAPTVLDFDLEFNEETTPKLQLIKEIMNSKEIGKNDQILLYSTYKETHLYLEQWFNEQGHSVRVLNGSTNDKEKQVIIDDFKQNKYKVLITNIQKGLNFGSVRNVIFYSALPNPGKMQQIEGRVTRSFDIKDKNFFLLCTRGKELTNLQNKIKNLFEESMRFSGEEVSAIGSLLAKEVF